VMSRALASASSAVKSKNSGAPAGRCMHLRVMCAP
jgi:hypothetical protein